MKPYDTEHPHYKKYLDTLRTAGVPESDIADVAAHDKRHHEALDTGKCPVCGKSVVGRKDGTRGVGPIPDGIWTTYFCDGAKGGCGFHLSRQEGDVVEVPVGEHGPDTNRVRPNPSEMFKGRNCECCGYGDHLAGVASCAAPMSILWCHVCIGMGAEPSLVFEVADIDPKTVKHLRHFDAALDQYFEGTKPLPIKTNKGESFTKRSEVRGAFKNPPPPLPDPEPVPET